jgi:UDP-MurNAc hydroxylase
LLPLFTFLRGSKFVGSLNQVGVPSMKVRLISHASVVISTSDTAIWTDPWLISKAFNDSWSLWPPPAFDESLLPAIDYLWLSHEHPDHLNFPTLASLPDSFKKRVVILFQNNNPERIFASLKPLGYACFQVLPHRETVKLTPRTSVYCFRVGTLDSCLAVSADGATILNANDARLNRDDCERILRDLGPIDTVLNQFSLAVKDLVVDESKHAIAARSVLESVSAVHQNLGARVTIPFASFMYFSSSDNRRMNAYANTPAKVASFCQERGQEVAILYPGDDYEVGAVHDSQPALARFAEADTARNSAPYYSPATVSMDQLSRTFRELVEKLRSRYPLMLLNRIAPLRIRIPDLDLTAEISIASGTIREVSTDQPDGIIYSQPLHYCFAQPWGMNTLTISGRFVILNNVRNWRIHKALLALNNSEVYLRARYLLRRQNWLYLRDRFNGMRRYKARTSGWT